MRCPSGESRGRPATLRGGMPTSVFGATPIDPHRMYRPFRGDATWQVRQRAVRGRTLNCAAPGIADRERAVHVVHHVVDDADRLAGDVEPRHVEGLRQQRAHPRVDEMAARHVARVGGALHEQLLLTGDERPDGNLRVVPAAWRSLDREEHGAAVRQHVRKTMAELPFRRIRASSMPAACRRRRRPATGLRHRGSRR